LKKEGIMRINSYNKFFVEVAKIMNTDIKAVKQLDGRYKVELTNHVYLNVYRGASGTLFVHDHRGIARITSCYDFDDFKTLKDLYERLVTDYSTSEETEETEETTETAETEEPTETTHTPTLDFEYRNLMYTDECKAAHNDNTKYLMETHSLPPTHEPTSKKVQTSSIYGMFGQYPSTPYKRHSYREVDKVCGDCSHFNACMQGNQTVAPTCCMFDSLYRARKNPNWHHVSLATLANIDNDMLDDKRRLYLTVYHELNKTIKNLRKCNSGLTYDKAQSPFRIYIAELYTHKLITGDLRRFIEAKISMCNVECGVWSSEVEVATGQHKSRKYNRPILRY
jgi:hypothetical protein